MAMVMKNYSLALVALAGLCAGSTAYADRAGDVDVYAQVKAPAAVGQAPSVEVTVISGPRTALSAYSLSTPSPDGPRTVTASRMREFPQGDETAAIAFVILDQSMFMGNDDLPNIDESNSYGGVLHGLEVAIDGLPLAKMMPAGSVGMIVTYDSGAKVKVPLGSLDRITGAALGTQADYQTKLGDDMVEGITLAMAELNKAPTNHKLLVVIGDGNDTNNEAAKAALLELKKEAAKDNIRIAAVMYKTVISADGAVITVLDPNTKTVNSTDGMAAALRQIVNHAFDRYYLTFPGAGLPWDGKPHDVTLRIGTTDTDPVALTLAPAIASPSHVPWALVLGLAAVLAALVIVWKRRSLQALFIGTALCVLGSHAHADSNIDVYMTVKTPDQKDPKQQGKAPGLEVTVVGGPKLPLEKFALSTTNKNVKVTMHPEKLREYTDGTETIAIALVINGQMIWIGTDEIQDIDDNSKYPGVLKNLEQAIDKLQLGNQGPPGSKGMVISYSTGADIKVPMGDLKNITGAALGEQKDYKGKIGTDMVSGITGAMSELLKVSTARKALIVVGDGNDTNNEAAKTQLVDLKKQAAREKVQLFAIIYKDPVSSDGAVITTMIPNAKTVNSIDGIAQELNAIIARMADRYYLSFPGYDEKTGEMLPWDDKEHDLVLKIDQTDTDPVTMTLAPVWNLPVKSSFPWLIILLVVGGLLLLFIIIKIATRKKAEPMPAPAPVMMMAPEAPKPMGPSKTVMIGAGGDQEGFPIVGWLVPLNGVNAYQTWRLKPGLTKIGTAPPADLVVNDGFMSTEHCSITCSPAGFTLHDNGATNGCYVNDRKVQKQDLVDNDVIMLGKTSFRFKSIN